MIVPETVEKHAREYIRNKNLKSLDIVVRWLTKLSDIEEEDITGIFITDMPTGKRQDIQPGNSSEYCEQWPVGCDGDSFHGYYYHKMKSGEWLGYSYEV